MAIFEHERAAPDTQIQTPTDTDGYLANTQEVDALMRDAMATDIERIEPGEDEDYTHVIKRDGEAIGAAAVYTRSVPLGRGREVHAAEIEYFDTNPANHHSAYLALLVEVISSDPELKSVNGVQGPEMAAVASELGYYLPLGWACEYRLVGGPNRVEVTTYDPQDIVGQIENGGSIEHAFMRTSSI